MDTRGRVLKRSVLCWEGREIYENEVLSELIGKVREMSFKVRITIIAHMLKNVKSFWAFFRFYRGRKI